MTAKPLLKRVVKKQLLPSSASTLPDRFVAASVRISPAGTLVHAGIAVGSEAGNYLFHYNSSSLVKANLEYCDTYYQREFETIPSYLADAFYVHCSEAMDSCTPEYGKFYNGTYFKGGKIINPNECAPFRMSCVGFCLGVLQGFYTEGEIFMAYEDWTADNSLPEIAIKVEQNDLKRLYPYLEDEELFSDIRRIKPSEYLASAYLDETPITKVSVDPIAAMLKEIAVEIKDEKD